jgi:hypothetical protein
MLALLNLAFRHRIVNQLRLYFQASHGREPMKCHPSHMISRRMHQALAN